MAGFCSFLEDLERALLSVLRFLAGLKDERRSALFQVLAAQEVN